MGAASTSAPRRTAFVLAVIAVAAWCSILPGVALADPVGGEATPTPSSTPIAAIAVTATPLVAEGREDGDLVASAEEAGPAALFFSPDRPVEQTAVHEIRVRNTGDVTVFDLAVSDDRMGEVVTAGSVTELGPGEEVVAFAAVTLTFDEVATGLAGLFTTTTTAVATTDDGTEVAATADTRVELVAVLATPTIDVALEVVPGVGDVAAAGAHVVQWTAAQRDADEVRVVRYRTTVTNTGSVALSDVELTVDVLGAALLSGADAVGLTPGEVLVREFDREIRAGELAADTVRGAAVDLATTVTATAVDTSQGLTATAHDTVEVRAALVAPEPTVTTPAPELPAAGLEVPTSHALLTALAALVLGALLLRWPRPAGD